jgi:cysteine desulfurase/selenocysteine lyase
MTTSDSAVLDERMLAELMNQMYRGGPAQGPAQAQHQAQLPASAAPPMPASPPMSMPMSMPVPMPTSMPRTPQDAMSGGAGALGSEADFLAQFEQFSRQGGMLRIPLLGQPGRPAGFDSAQPYWLAGQQAGAGAALYWMPSEAAGPTSGPATGFDVEAVRRDFPILRQRVNGKPLVWLDNAATTQKPQAVIARISKFYEEENSNVHRAAHELAARATDAYEGAREKCRRFLGAAAVEEIIFTRGTTESINLVAQSWGKKNLRPGDEIILLEYEHHANIVPWQHIARETGAVIRVAPIVDSGEIDLAAYERLFSGHTRIVGLGQVSNVLGTIAPVREMIATAHRHGAVVLVDGAQSAPHFPVNVQEMDADFFVMSGHKLFGPTGVGVLYGKRHLLDDMPPWQGGGNMIRQVSFEHTSYADVPAKFEAGTPILAGAVGLGAAIDYLGRIGFANAARYEDELLQYGQQRLAAIPGVRMIGTARHKAGVLSFVSDRMPPSAIGEALNQAGIAVRVGHHCAQPALAHYGLKESVRPSLAFYNTRAEVDLLVQTVSQVLNTGGRGPSGAR